MNLFKIVGFSLLSLWVCAGSAELRAHTERRGSQFHSQFTNVESVGIPLNPSGDVGIKESVPQELQNRYKKWKGEVLSTEFGRKQWEHYANSKTFLLKIVVSRNRKHGAGTADFVWNDNGDLVGATITLGKNLDEGFPDPVYYPVMNSLATYNGLYEVNGDILASTKIIHEIGHVSNTEQTNGEVFQQQNRLINSYNTIFLKNGYNIRDPRLIALADELGAKPIEVWESREYQSEVKALRYILERMGGEPSYCSVLSRMQRNITAYARTHQESFQQVVREALPNSCED